VDLPLIASLNAGLAPHRQWAVRQWFYANPIWYYHRLSATHEICPRGRFYDLIDPLLREICHLANAAGIPTTPSCQGHAYPRERFESIWDQLNRDELEIRGAGLEVKDCESEKRFLCRDNSFVVPWPTFIDFYNEATRHQGIGYLGLILPPTFRDIEHRLLDDRYHTVTTRTSVDAELAPLLGGNVFSIYVQAVTEPARTAEWRHVTNYLRALLRAQGNRSEFRRSHRIRPGQPEQMSPRCSSLG
jgi:hypothetical protein